MLAYKNDPAIKAKFLNRVKRHRKADEIVHGHGYWNDGKGCAVGCTLHSDQHKSYETQLGIPERLAQLEDAIFEGLPVELARKWPERFLSAITPGADLSLVWHKFAVWMLRDSEFLTITDVNRDAIAVVVRLHVRTVSGDVPTQDEWSAAESAAESAAWPAWSAAWSARSAAWSAAESARSAAESAARSAAWSAWSAAWSAAESAAWPAAYEKMADKLIKLLKAAK